VNPSEITTYGDWRLYEGLRWLDAVRENGLNVRHLDEDERWMMEQAESAFRAKKNEAGL